jgi:integrase
VTRRRGLPGPDPIEIQDAWEQAVTDWRMEMRAAGRTAESLRLGTHYVRMFARTCETPQKASRRDLITFLSRSDWAPETRKSARTSLRGFFSWAAATDVIEADPAASLPPVRVPQADPRPATDDAIRQALTAASDRVRLMVLLGAVAGLRRAEIARVHSDDLDRDGELVVWGKGGRRRTIGLDPALVALLHALPPGWAFPGRDGHMSPAHVGKLVTNALPAGTTPHMLRHACASALYEDGLGLLELRALLGHSSVATTQRYVRIRSARTTAAMGARLATLTGAR